MDIITTAAARGYQLARPATTPEADSGSSLRGMVADFTAVLQHSEDTAKAAMTGKADPHALVQALSATELAVETAVTLRDKVVEAYQEILRMPV